MMTFNVVDVETANSRYSSICQIGVVHVRDGRIHGAWKSLVNPEERFSPSNIRVHGIKQHHVMHSPTLPQVDYGLRRRLRDAVLVSHSPFDRVAFRQAMAKYELEPLPVTWLDSVMIARRAWPERSGFSLGSLARDLGIEFEHHDALEDARACAEVVLRACNATGLNIDNWRRRIGRR